MFFFIKTIIKSLFCKHRYLRVRTIHGDEANFARSEWLCIDCGKGRFSQHLGKVDVGRKAK